MLCDIQDRRGLRGLPRQRPLTTPSAVLLERSARSGGTRAPPLVRLPPSTGDLGVPCLPTHCSDSCPVSRAPAAETRATRPHILRDWLRLEGRKDPVPDGVLGVLRTALGPGWARAPHGPAFPSRSHEGTHQPLERVLQGHLGSWPPLLGMGRREWLVFRRQLCPSLSPRLVREPLTFAERALLTAAPQRWPSAAPRAEGGPRTSRRD